MNYPSALRLYRANDGRAAGLVQSSSDYCFVLPAHKDSLDRSSVETALEVVACCKASALEGGKAKDLPGAASDAEERSTTEKPSRELVVVRREAKSALISLKGVVA